jgi:hypothetical protein
MRIVTIIAGLVVALLLNTALTQPVDVGDDGLGLGAKAAQASWYYTCKTSRDEHTHYLRERIHVWKNVTQWHSGGRYYVRGTWATINMNSGEQIASDRRTYDCTGAG